MNILLDLEKKIEELILRLTSSQNPPLAADRGCLGGRSHELSKKNVKSGQSFFPRRRLERTLVLVLTERCNLRCAYCLRNTKDESKEVPFPVLKRIVLSAHRFGIKDFSITGGEIFTYPDWRELVKLIGILGSTLFIETNGYDLKEEDIVFLKNTLADRITKILVSLDSYDAAIHDRFRGQGTFNMAVSTIKLLRKYGIPIEVNVLLTPLNFMNEKEISKYLDFVKGLGVGEVSFGEVVALGRGKNSQFSLNENQRRQIKQIFIENNYSQNSKGIKISSSFLKTINGAKSCDRLGREISVSPHGLHPCVFNIDTIKVGDFNDFEKMLYSDFLNSLHFAGWAMQQCFKKQDIFNCSKCVKYLPQWLSLIKNKITPHYKNIYEKD